MVVSVDLASITATQEGTSPRLVVDVDDPRPLSAAARQLEPYTSPLSAPIDMPTEERTGLDIVTDIARRLSGETGRRIWVGMMPTNLMVQTSVTVGARNESARSVLWRALQQLHPSLSWQLLCSVGEQADCALNIHAVPRE